MHYLLHQPTALLPASYNKYTDLNSTALVYYLLHLVHYLLHLVHNLLHLVHYLLYGPTALLPEFKIECDSDLN